MKRSAVMFIAIGGPKAHVTLSMTDTLFQQPASLGDGRGIGSLPCLLHHVLRQQVPAQEMPSGRGASGFRVITLVHAACGVVVADQQTHRPLRQLLPLFRVRNSSIRASTGSWKSPR